VWGEFPGGDTLTHSPQGGPEPSQAPTVDEGAVQPLDVVVVGEGEQHLVADDGEGQQEDGAQRHGQGEGAEPQPAGRTSRRVPAGVTAQPRPPGSPARAGWGDAVSRPGRGEEAAEHPAAGERAGQEPTRSC